MTSNRDNNWFCTRREKADLVGVSYRLTPETGERLLGDFAEAADELRARGVRFAFGGTPPVAARAEGEGANRRAGPVRACPAVQLLFQDCKGKHMPCKSFYKAC